MRPTQRNLTKRSILLLSLLLSVTSSMAAGQDVGIVTNIKNNTCQGGISSNGNIDLGIVGVSDFTGNISVENCRPGERGFTIIIQDCILQGTGNVLNQLHTSFCTLNDVTATGFNQILTNEDSAGAKNVGVVTFSVQDPMNTFNAPSVTGSSRSVYPAMSSVLNNSSWKFSARMQRIDPALNVISGPLIGYVLMDIYYE